MLKSLPQLEAEIIKRLTEGAIEASSNGAPADPGQGLQNGFMAATTPEENSLLEVIVKHKMFSKHCDNIRKKCNMEKRKHIDTIWDGKKTASTSAARLAKAVT